jgi:hypothetical protein
MKRLALAVALLLAAIVSARSSSGWHPGCVLFERYSLEWYFNGCWYGEPDPPPGSNEG